MDDAARRETVSVAEAIQDFGYQEDDHRIRQGTALDQPVEIHAIHELEHEQQLAGWVTLDPSPRGAVELAPALEAAALWLDALRMSWHRYVVTYSFKYGGRHNTLASVAAEALVVGVLNSTTAVLGVFVFLGLLHEKGEGLDARAFAQ